MFCVFTHSILGLPMRNTPFLTVAIVLTAVLFTSVSSRSQTTAQRDRVVPTIKGAPEWLAKYKFPQPEFVFVRVQFSSVLNRQHWATDFPDADLNFSAQLRQLTSLKVSEQTKALKLTDPQLSKYPFIYMAEPGTLELNDTEVQCLRKYLLDGGFLMVDDFWGEREWENLHEQMKRVFPDREPAELPLEHKLFHCVFDLKEKPQVPSIHVALAGQTTERADAQKVHYKALFDDRGRMMAILCHNTDLADGWERVGVDETYFREYSEKKAYPMGINIIFFALTQAR